MTAMLSVVLNNFWDYQHRPAIMQNEMSHFMKVAAYTHTHTHTHINAFVPGMHGYARLGKPKVQKNADKEGSGL